MDILDVINKIDLELLKNQGQVIEQTIFRLEEEKREFADPENVERCEYDIDALTGVLELIDNLVIALENT